MPPEILGVENRPKTQLLKIIEATNPAGPLLGLGQRGQQHGRQDRNDGNHHQQFDEGEGARYASPATNNRIHANRARHAILDRPRIQPAVRN